MYPAFDDISSLFSSVGVGVGVPTGVLGPAGLGVWSLEGDGVVEFDSSTNNDWLFIYLSICLFVCLSVYRMFACFCMCVCVCLSTCVFVCLSVYMCVCLSFCLHVCLSISRSICRSIYLSVIMFMHNRISVFPSLFFCLSVCL